MYDIVMFSAGKEDATVQNFSNKEFNRNSECELREPQMERVHKLKWCFNRFTGPSTLSQAEVKPCEDNAAAESVQMSLDAPYWSPVDRSFAFCGNQDPRGVGS